MIGVGLVVLASVVVLGLIAAPDVTARGAHAEVYPGRADLQTILASVGPRRYRADFRRDVRAIIGHWDSVSR